VDSIFLLSVFIAFRYHLYPSLLSLALFPHVNIEKGRKLNEQGQNDRRGRGGTTPVDNNTDVLRERQRKKKFLLFYLFFDFNKKFCN
jgi:hypothetical protein